METLASPTRKEPSINKKIHMRGKTHVLFCSAANASTRSWTPSHGFSAAGGWRGARGISAFLPDQSLELALSLEQWAQPRPALPARLRCSAPGFIFVRAWSGMRRSGDGARGVLGIACPAALCAHVHGSNEQAGMMERGSAGRVATLWLLDPFLLAEPAAVTSSWEKGSSLTVQGPLMLPLALAHSFATQSREPNPVPVLWHCD